MIILFRGGMVESFNPLDVNNIGVTLAVELLEQDICPLPLLNFLELGSTPFITQVRIRRMQA